MIIDLFYQLSRSRKMQRHNVEHHNHHKQLGCQNIEQSKMIQSDDQKSHRTVGNKQTQKKLQNLKPQQYEKIVANLTAQNKMLKQEVANLRGKVDQLLVSKKITGNHKKNSELQEQMKKAKKQLQLKYYSMNYLKQQLRKQKQTAFTQEIRFKVEQQKQQITMVEQQIKKLTKEKERLMREVEINKSCLEEEDSYSKVHRDRIATHKQQNKELKAKIQQLNKASETKTQKLDNQKQSKQKQSKQKQSKQKQPQQKQQKQKISRSFRENKNSKSKLPVSSMKNIDQGQISNLQIEVKKLKEQKYEIENNLTKQQRVKKNRKEKLENQTKKNMEIHQLLIHNKIKIVNQNNLYQNKGKKIKEDKEIKQNKESQQILYDHYQCQTDNITINHGRKQWIGKKEGIPFDDSVIFENKNHVFIKSVTIYKSTNFIGFVKFFYQNSNKEQYESKVPFDPMLLKSYECKKYSNKNKGYLQSFIIILTNGIVTGLSLTWCDGQSVVEGSQLPNSTKFKADIDIKQRPVSMFGSVVLQNKNLYALESLGCQVMSNDNSE